MEIELIVFVLLLCVIAFSLLTRRLARTFLTLPIIFVALGFAVSEPVATLDSHTVHQAAPGPGQSRPGPTLAGPFLGPSLHVLTEALGPEPVPSRPAWYILSRPVPSRACPGLGPGPGPGGGIV